MRPKDATAFFRAESATSSHKELLITVWTQPCATSQEALTNQEGHGSRTQVGKPFGEDRSMSEPCYLRGV